VSDAYEKKLRRARAALGEQQIAALEPAGRGLLHDAIMIMAFADGEVDEMEERFLEDFVSPLATNGKTSDDLTEETLIERATALCLGRELSEGFLKVLLIVSDLDDNIDDDELALWHQLGSALSVGTDRIAALRKLV